MKTFPKAYLQSQRMALLNHIMHHSMGAPLVIACFLIANTGNAQTASVDYGFHKWVRQLEFGKDAVADAIGWIVPTNFRLPSSSSEEEGSPFRSTTAIVIHCRRAFKVCVVTKLVLGETGFWQNDADDFQIVSWTKRELVAVGQGICQKYVWTLAFDSDQATYEAIPLPAHEQTPAQGLKCTWTKTLKGKLGEFKDVARPK